MAARKTSAKTAEKPAKPTTKKAATKTSATRKSASKKTDSKKSATKKAATTKTATKKSASKKAASRKAAAKKPASKKKASAEAKPATGKAPAEAKPAATKPTPAPKAAKGDVAAEAVNLGHIFALRPRVETSFPQDALRRAKSDLRDERYGSLEEAARAVAEKALETTRKKPGKHGPGRG